MKNSAIESTQPMYSGAGLSVCLTNDRWGRVKGNLFEITNYAVLFGDLGGTEMTHFKLKKSIR